MGTERKGDSLENTALKRICRDIDRHSMLFEAMAEKVPYLILQRDYCHEIMEEMKDISCLAHSNEDFPEQNLDLRFCAKRHKKISKCSLDFIFNKYLKTIDLTSGELNGEEVLSVISRNCKELHYFTIREAKLTAEAYVPIFNSTEHLVVLRLYSCTNLSLKVLEAIEGSLRHLRILELEGTPIDEEGLFVLSGHKPSSDIHFPNILCCYTKHCEVTSSLKLQRINIPSYNGSEAGVACLLTHIPTLQQVSPTYFHKVVTGPLQLGLIVCDLPSAILKINKARSELKLPSITFQLEEMGAITEIEECGTLFQSCPKLKSLVTSIACYYPKQLLEEALTSIELPFLKRIVLNFSLPQQILTEKFMCFWRLKGCQLTDLRFQGAMTESGVHCNSSVFGEILVSCPNLHILCVNTIYCLLNANAEHFPQLPKLEKLFLFLKGEVEAVTSFASKIICSAINVIEVHLGVPGGTNFFVNLLTKDVFPKLQVTEIKQYDNNLSIFLQPPWI